MAYFSVFIGCYCHIAKNARHFACFKPYWKVMGLLSSSLTAGINTDGNAYDRKPAPVNLGPASLVLGVETGSGLDNLAGASGFAKAAHAAFFDAIKIKED